MDEKKKQISSTRNPAKVLKNIDDVLDSAYRAPRKPAFSTEIGEKTNQKTVLYHRILENPFLRDGEKSTTNDIRYEALADAIIEGRDPVVEFIKTRPVREQPELLEELVVSGKRMAWFEDMLTRSEQKKSEAAAANADKNDISRFSEAQITREGSIAQSELFRSLAENRGADPKDFFRKPENVARTRRMLAVELHRRQVEHELEELQQVYGYESVPVKAEKLKNRPPFAFESSAAENTEEHLKRLENSHEVLGMLQRMAQCSDLKELSRLVIDPPRPKSLRLHDSLSLMENKLVPDAIMAFFNSSEAPKTDSKEEKALLSLSAMSGVEFPRVPTGEDCEQRINEYSSVLKLLEKGGLLKGENGQKLKQELGSQIERLEDMVTAPDRERIQFNFRADTLIDYVDVKDHDRRPMDAIEAREKLVRGAELEQTTFNDDDFVGISQKVTYDKNTGLINKGPEKLITRYMNLSEKAGKKPELQLEELRKIRDLMKMTDPFYVKNSVNYNNVLDSLNKVIKTQESMDRDANVRQVAELRALYAELDSNAAKYVKDKSDRMKKGDDRAQIRVDAVKTLQSLTGEKHVGRVTLKLFDEQKKLDDQQKMVKPCKKIMDKWKNAGTPSTPEALAEFKRDFDSLSSRFEMIRSNYGQVPYFKMSIAEELENFTQKAEEIQKIRQKPDRTGELEKNSKPERNLDPEKLSAMIKLRNESREALNGLYAMNPTAGAPKKEIQKEIPKENFPKKKSEPEKILSTI